MEETEGRFPSMENMGRTNRLEGPVHGSRPCDGTPVLELQTTTRQRSISLDGQRLRRIMRCQI